MISSQEFFRLSLTSQCTLLGTDGVLIGTRKSGHYKVKLYLIYDFLVEVFFEHNGWVSTTAMPDSSMPNSYQRCFGQA
ncbi:MAG: hypothetical protein RMJ87_13715 [Cytophagales bacterium]|nr:hypothetical protein [Bernardetiaceae bacterium]MDW8206080.1 hypothetical protein [Cytophagales bacterium]